MKLRPALLPLVALPVVLLPLIAVLVGAAAGRVPSGEGRKSQPARVEQRLGGLLVTVAYNRPAARGRELFGGIVPWDSVWCPGADEATTIEVSDDVLLGGRPLAKGRSSVWAIPRPAEWTLILSRKWDVPHVPYPAGDDALRLGVRPTQAAHVESLLYSFPAATPDSALLSLRWGTTEVALPLRPAAR